MRCMRTPEPPGLRNDPLIFPVKKLKKYLTNPLYLVFTSDSSRRTGVP